MDPVLLLGNVATVCTIANYFSGLPLCLGFFKKGSTSSVSVLPFVAGVTCASLWLQYSLLLNDRLLQTVNVTGVTLQTFYILCYYMNTTEKRKVKNLSSLAFAFLLTIYIYGFYYIDRVAAKNFLGLSASAGTILAYSAPLATVNEVLRTKNSESLPLPMVFGGFVVSTLWFFYGLLLKDAYIQVPNIIGSIFSVIQLSLIALFPARKKDEGLKKE